MHIADDELLADYRDAMAEQDRAEREVARWSDTRAYTLAQLHARGWSLAGIADVVGLSRARVQQLVERGRRVDVFECP